jgi:dihydrofolate reductase
MRKLYFFMVVSLDGFSEGPNGEFDWPVVDQEFNEFGIEQLHDTDALVFGRVTYEGMAAYWPTPAAREDDPVVAELMNGLPKVVVSTTLTAADWARPGSSGRTSPRRSPSSSRSRARAWPSWAAPNLTVSLLGTGLVDELRVMIHPILLGGGRSLFRTLGDRLALELLQTRTFRSGNLLLTYRPA